VKLGTITPEGDASIHCYACDEEVLDNFLKDHLANFGIEVEK
jgi:ubiquitin carboxyl-terminal hydrolase 5/13